MAFWVDAVVKNCLNCTRKLGLKIIFRIAWDYYAADIYDGVWYEFVLWTIQQRYTYRVLQTIQMKLILLWVWADRAVLGRAKTALKFKYEI